MSHNHINFLQEFETYMVEQRDSATRMYLFKVLRRQAIDIINIINAVPVPILLTLNSYARSCSKESLALYENTALMLHYNGDRGASIFISKFSYEYKESSLNLCS